MNYVFVSPYFPTNFYKLCQGLKKAGVTVLGLGDWSYEDLSPDLKEALTEYYRVESLEDEEEKLRACGYFTHKYGKIHRIESNNEYWLESDARLRTLFAVDGLKEEEITPMKYKSRMKEIFRTAGLDVARGQVVKTMDEARNLIAEVGYPVVVKPDNGVGASSTYKLHTEEEIKDFFDAKKDVDYIMEEYIEGEIQTFDGLVDQSGEVVFPSCMVFKKGIMETVNDGLDMYYYIPRELPEDIVEAGLKTVKAFGLKERFFHFEYFKTPEGRVIALEVNVRPPGGLTLDMFNYANDMNIYEAYGKVVAENRFDAVVSRRHNCFYIGRKNFLHYRHTVDEVLHRFGNHVVFHEPISPLLAPAIGDYGFVLRSDTVEEGEAIVRFVLEKA